MMLKVVNLHQKPRKNRSQKKVELKYQGKYPQNRTKNHSTNPTPFFLARPTEKLYRNCLLCDFVTFQTVKQNLQHSRFFFSGIKNLYSRFKINGGIIAVLRFFLFMSNLAKQQIFNRNVSNVKQLIGSMGDMDRTSVFFPIHVHHVHVHK